MSGRVIYAILSSFNRRTLTLRCLGQLLEAESEALQIRVTLFDDGSTDGTVEAVLEQFPRVHIIRGTGDAYWAKSMALAEKAVLRSVSEQDDGFILWLNDDVFLRQDAVRRAIAAADRTPGAVIVGAMQDTQAGNVTYSGMQRHGRHPLRYTKVAPGDKDRVVDAFNGNFVLVPLSTARKVGGIDGRFSHAWADIDYAYRCFDNGIPAILPPGYFGECDTNAYAPYPGLMNSWQRFIGKKGGGNPRSLYRILRRHGGHEWPVYFLATYILWWGRTLLHRKHLRTQDSSREVEPLSKHLMSVIPTASLLKWRKIAARLQSGLRWRFHTHVARADLGAKGATVGLNLRVYGRVEASIIDGATVSLGRNVVLCGESRFTALGVAHETVIRALTPEARIDIGDDVGISGASICAAYRIAIGDRTLIGADATIADTDFHPVHEIPRRWSPLPKAIDTDAVNIGRDVFIGARAFILKGVSVGDGAVVGAGAVVTKDVPSGAIVAGNPAVVVGRVRIAGQGT